MLEKEPIYVASKNNDKIKEIQEILTEYQIIPIKDLKIDVVEDENTFEKNAIKKAITISKSLSGKLCIADDSGIEIEYLDGFPGVNTKRWYKGTDRQRNLEILKKLEGIPREKRKVNFITAIAIAKNNECIVEKAKLQGYISLDIRGNNGFGFDEIFELENGKTLAELTASEKNNISSRKKAIERIKLELGRFMEKTYIDFVKAEVEFKQYLKEYDKNDGNIILKIKHTYEVVKQSEYIAEKLDLDEENVELAKIIGLLHDIGRFEQVKQTSDFTDNSKFDHADYGVKILFEDNLIRKFIKDSKYDEIIKKAIYNHNKYEIEKDLDELTNLHCKIIRDADKLDNFRVKQTENFRNIFPSKYNPETINYETISTKVYNDFMEHKSIKLEDRKTQIDYWICVLAFIFDLNFDVSLKYIKEKNYIDILIDRIEYKNEDTKLKMEEIRKCAKEYLN